MLAKKPQRTKSAKITIRLDRFVRKNFDQMPMEEIVRITGLTKHSINKIRLHAGLTHRKPVKHAITGHTRAAIVARLEDLIPVPRIQEEFPQFTLSQIRKVRELDCPHLKGKWPGRTEITPKLVSFVKKNFKKMTIADLRNSKGISDRSIEKIRAAEGLTGRKKNDPAISGRIRATIIRQINKKVPIPQICQAFPQFTAGQIRAVKLLECGGLINPHWTEGEKRWLVANYHRTNLAQQMKRLKKTEKAIYLQAHRLGVKRNLFVAVPVALEQPLIRRLALNISIAKIIAQYPRLTRRGILAFAKSHKQEIETYRMYRMPKSPAGSSYAARSKAV